jgi:hypothetical protein
VSQSTDGTTLNSGSGGDLVSDEDLTGLVRQSPAVPQLGAANAAYKIERTKIVIGEYGQDRGDVSSDGGRPFPVETFAERRMLEVNTAVAIDTLARDAVRRQREREPRMMFNARIGRSGREGI